MFRLSPRGKIKKLSYVGDVVRGLNSTNVPGTRYKYKYYCISLIAQRKPRTIENQELSEIGPQGYANIQSTFYQIRDPHHCGQNACSFRRTVAVLPVVCSSGPDVVLVRVQYKY